MSAAEFMAAAVVVPVKRSDPGAVARLQVSAKHLPQLQAFRRAAQSAMRSRGLPDLSAQIERECMDLGHRDDVWHSRLPNGTVVILVREELYEILQEREVVEQVHRAEVEAAITRGESVPQETMRYYREKDGQQAQLQPAGY